ncbi:unnamed protein product [Closterium sp. NIES-54]
MNLTRVNSTSRAPSAWCTTATATTAAPRAASTMVTSSTTATSSTAATPLPPFLTSLAPARCACRRVIPAVPSRPVTPAVPSRRPCRRVAPAVPSRPVAPAVPSRRPCRRVAPAVPSCLVAPAVPSRRPLLSLLSRRVALSVPSLPVPSHVARRTSHFPSRPVAHAPCALPVRRAPAVPCPSVAPPLRPARPLRPVRPARPSRPHCTLPVRRAPCALPVRACHARPCQSRPVQSHRTFSVWLLRARRLLESQVQAHETLWAHASGDLPEPAGPAPLVADSTPADSDRYAREHADVTAWKSRDAAACIALSSLLPESEEIHFTQVRTASEFLTAIKARYATPTTVSLGRMFLPFLFPGLASFERTADLITHLRSLDSSYRATCTDAQLALLPPPMAITIYFIATSLPGRLASVRDALLLKHPSELTIEVLESALKDVESNLRSVASASCDVPPSPPSPPVSGPPLPPPNPSLSAFPPPLPSLSPPLSHAWPSRRSPRACSSSPVPFTDLRTSLFRSSPPRSSPSVLPSPPELALTASLSTLVTDYYRMYRPVLSHILASLVTDPRASMSSVSTLTAAVTEFASTRCLDYATGLVAAPPTSPLAVGGESALGCDALEDRQFELEFLAAASPHLCAMLLAPEGDPDALDIPTPRTYAEAVSGPWASQWRAAMDSELASYRSTGTYVDKVPPPGANVVDGMWIFRVKRPPGSPPVFKARYVARGFSQREGPTRGGLVASSLCLHWHFPSWDPVEA